MKHSRDKTNGIHFVTGGGFAIYHNYVILPKLFPHYLSLILIFRYGKDSGVGVTVGQYL